MYARQRQKRTQHSTQYLIMFALAHAMCAPLVHINPCPSKTVVHVHSPPFCHELSSKTRWIRFNAFKILNKIFIEDYFANSSCVIAVSGWIRPIDFEMNLLELIAHDFSSPILTAINSFCSFLNNSFISYNAYMYTESVCVHIVQQHLKFPFACGKFK